MNSRDTGSKAEWSSATAAWVGIGISVLFSAISLVLSFVQFRSGMDTGELIPHSPTEFCIARGFRNFPSDHIILPISFENTGKGAKTIDMPTLSFVYPDMTYLETASDVDLPPIALQNMMQWSTSEIQFSMAGFISGELDSRSVENNYELAQGITVPEHSLARYILVFQVQDWWKESSNNFIFRFPYIADETQHIPMRLSYFEPGKEGTQIWNNGGTFVSMPIFETINRLTLGQDLVELQLSYEDVTNVPDLVTFLQMVPTGTYRADCFSFSGMPDFVPPNE